MEVPGLGTVEPHEEFGWLGSQPLPIGALGGRRCRIYLAGYDADPHREEFHDAIANVRSTERNLLDDAAAHVFRYYRDVSLDWDRGDPAYIEVAPERIWQHVQLGSELHICRRRHGDRAVCGLQLVFKRRRLR